MKSFSSQEFNSDFPFVTSSSLDTTPGEETVHLARTVDQLLHAESNICEQAMDHLLTEVMGTIVLNVADGERFLINSGRADFRT